MWTDSILDTGVLGWDKCSWVRQHVFEDCCHIWIHFQKHSFNNAKIAQIVNMINIKIIKLILINASLKVRKFRTFTCKELWQCSLVMLITQSPTSQPAQHILPGCGPAIEFPWSYHLDCLQLSEESYAPIHSCAAFWCVHLLVLVVPNVQDLTIHIIFSEAGRATGRRMHQNHSECNFGFNLACSVDLNSFVNHIMCRFMFVAAHWSNANVPMWISDIGLHDQAEYEPWPRFQLLVLVAYICAWIKEVLISAMPIHNLPLSGTFDEKK